MITVSYPSLTTYNELEISYSSTIRCPCAKIVNPYGTFVSFSPVFHQVCTSYFVQNFWVELLKDVELLTIPYDWIGTASSQFQLLSVLCELTNMTVNDAIHRFIRRPFVSSEVVTKTNFVYQSETAVNQFIEYIAANFRLLLDGIILFTQVDQPYAQPSILDSVPNANAKLIFDVFESEAHSDNKTVQAVSFIVAASAEHFSIVSRIFQENLTIG